MGVTGARQTRQREAILGVIARAEGPLSAPELHARALRELPGLGVATVYRTLKLLAEQGRVRAVNLGGESRFEAEGLGHHHHFACRVCERVFDLDTCPLKALPSVEVPGGFVVEAHEITLYGLCPDCAAR